MKSTENYWFDFHDADPVVARLRTHEAMAAYSIHQLHSWTQLPFSAAMRLNTLSKSLTCTNLLQYLKQLQSRFTGRVSDYTVDVRANERSVEAERSPLQGIGHIFAPRLHLWSTCIAGVGFEQPALIMILMELR
jgi:hypothetical protein